MNIKIVIILIALLLLVVVPKVFSTLFATDAQCAVIHQTKFKPPAQTISAQDYFAAGNYEYDRGNCLQAIDDYANAIQLDPYFSRAYNNRAYTNMRLHNYQAALSDLNQAIAIDPNYVTALMNRGDIYNYYYQQNKEKAIKDYDRVIALGKNKDKSGSVCGHKAMALANHILPFAWFWLMTNTSC